jgi:glycosyltransferase involved in cell wall biosynthesis
MPPGPIADGIRANKVVCLSEFHADAWRLPREVVAIIGNGVDLALYWGSETMPRDENRVLWTANPDRGLPLAAKIFVEEILPRWPDLELHVYGRSSVYGWPPENEGPFIPRIEHLRNSHIVMHDPLTKAGLANELRRAWAWFYPTWWPETYCIAALEAQAAGCPVIASPYAALNETVEGGILTYDFVNAFSQLRNKNRWEKLSEAGKEHAKARDWSNRADQWIALIEETIAASATATEATSPKPQPSATPPTTLVPETPAVKEASAPIIPPPVPEPELVTEGGDNAEPQS